MTPGYCWRTGWRLFLRCCVWRYFHQCSGDNHTLDLLHDPPTRSLGFYREMKVVKVVAWVMLVGAPLFLSLSYVREALLVDSCLDSGGSFDYLRMICDRDVSHAFVPYSQRHGALVALVVLATLVAASYLTFKRSMARTD